MPDDDTIQQIAAELQKAELQAGGGAQSWQQIHQQLAAELNLLVAHNFSRLISLLYRLDISEKKLKRLLAESTDVTAGEVIAQMIIERQLQKIESRKAFKNNASDIPDDEKW